MSTLDDVLAEVVIFERRLQEASRRELQRDPDLAALGDGFPSRHWDLRGFATAYLHSHAYPDERLPAILHHLMDLKLKFYWLAEPSVVDGRALVRAGWALAAPTDHPDLYLRRLSLDVSQILISRSAFDSLMGAICFLEIGREIEALGRRGKVSRFFDLLNDSPAWSGFVRYRAVVEAFDERVRVAEAHKYSRLRAAFVDPTQNRPNVFAVSNAILVNFWENLVLVTAGMPPLVEHKGFDVDEVVRELREDERLDHEVAADEWTIRNATQSSPGLLAISLHYQELRHRGSRPRCTSAP